MMFAAAPEKWEKEIRLANCVRDFVKVYIFYINFLYSSLWPYCIALGFVL